MNKNLQLSLIFGLLVVLVAACAPPAAATPGAYDPGVDPANFVNGVDNPYFPLVPGTTFIFEGETADGFEHIEVQVTHETNVVMGVTCIVVRDTVTIDGELVEDTYDWYAQDAQGNVWYFGEAAKDYANSDVVSTAGSWEAGVDGALPGIVMQADPQVGVEYRQEYYVGEAEDMGKVLSLNVSITVPYGSFEGCLVTEDWTPLEPGFVEHKTYCPGVGTVRNEYVLRGSGSQELVAIEPE